jgi:hypothetical protein
MPPKSACNSQQVLGSLCERTSALRSKPRPKTVRADREPCLVAHVLSLPKKITQFYFGLMGRTPDAVAGNITGLSMQPEVLDAEAGGNSANLLKIYEHMRRDGLRAT